MIVPSSLFTISIILISLRQLTSTSINPNRQHDYSNCEVESEDYPRSCIRCSIEYVLIENRCVIKDKSHDSNCIELTRFGDCMICKCGYSLEAASNLCVETPEILIGCLMFHFSTEVECLRPKPEFELVKSRANNYFISIDFGNYSNCEIRIAESNLPFLIFYYYTACILLLSNLSIAKHISSCFMIIVLHSLWLSSILSTSGIQPNLLHSPYYFFPHPKFPLKNRG